MEAYTKTKGRRYEGEFHSIKKDFAKDPNKFINYSPLMKDPFKEDFVRIIQSKAYRRLPYKTQVISLPDCVHVRTRAIHTNEVIGISSRIADRLGLNLSLCEAIAAGHDIGHTPYGHAGEEVLSKFGVKPFNHALNGVLIAQHIERNGMGLNLCHETLEGMLNHSRGAGKLAIVNSKPAEYSVVMFSDKIAYTFSDLNG